ncbi:MAG: YihY/virulence factor BrkB family protein [Steroidobacteraceae bacterium]|jgi:membrane protein|nr:YihY/virulence factor BrkB family protein [Steroidobacteraceae bacterium]
MLEPLWRLLDHLLWGARAVGATPLAVTLRLLRYPYAVLRDLSRGQVNLRAMGLVYATLLSLVPLLAFSFAVLKVFGAHRELEPVVLEFFRPVGRSATALTARVMEFADSVSSGIVGSVGLALLLWTLIGTIQKVEDSFNFLWRVEQPRSFGRRIAEYLSLLVLGPLLLVVFLGLAHSAIQSAAVQTLAALPLLDRLMALGLAIAPYAMVTAIFTGLYMFVPNTSVRALPALAGGLAAGVLWAATGKVFTELVVYTTRLTVVYAGFAIIVAALLWTYLGWLILLVGVQLSFYVQNPSYLRLGLTELRLSSVELEELALKVMFLVGSAHTRGEVRWRVNDLARELGMPGIAISQVVSALERAGMLTANDREQLVPARDIGHIRLRDILEVARNQRSGHATARGLAVPEVDALRASLERAWRERCGERTLRDLIEAPA